MPRAARVLGLIDRLRGEAEVTVAQLAAEFGVSERTLQRDLAVLRDQACPSPASRVVEVACGSKARAA